MVQATASTMRTIVHAIGSFFIVLVGTSQIVGAGSVYPEPIPSVTHPDDQFQFAFIEENANLGFDGRDRHFTNGVQLSLLSPRLQPGNFANLAVKWFGQYTLLFLPQTDSSDEYFSGW